MSVVEWATAGAALGGEVMSGDRALVVPFERGALVAVIDGLGHGPAAADASAAAADVLSEAPTVDLGELVRRCHERMRATRGAAISLATFDATHAQMTWVGIGNVEGLLVHGSGEWRALPMRGGTVGYMLPPVRPQAVDIRPGDTLVLASDGVQPDFRSEISPLRSPGEIASAILEHHGKKTDDCCVLVVRYTGETVEGTLIDIDEDADVSQARILTRDLAHSLGFGHVATEALATAVSELARNILDHATRGEVEVGATRDRPGVIVVARDRGPGISDPSRALADGFSTGSGLGLGLPGARRLVDELQLDTQPGVGTTVTLRKWLR